MRAFLLLLVPGLVAAGPEFTLAAHDDDRRWILVEAPAPAGLDGPLHVVEVSSGKKLPAQSDGKTLRWLVEALPAGRSAKYALGRGEAPGAKPMSLVDDAQGIGVKGGDGRLITRYVNGSWAEEHKKPFWYPLVGHGVNVTRSWPMEANRGGEAEDHPHHTAIYHTYDEVSGQNFWSKKATMTPVRVIRREAGPVYARLTVEHAWGPDLVEVQDVFILNAGDDAVMDFAITMTADGPVEFGKTKEGGFSVRVTTGLTNKNGGKVKLIDARGHEGEPEIRKHKAPWVDYAGEVDGKKVGVAIMDHPSSFRYPTNWHVRGYGCFAANRWFVDGGHEMKKGDSFDVKYRVYVHEGDAAKGKVAETYAGFAKAAAE